MPESAELLTVAEEALLDAVDREGVETGLRARLLAELHSDDLSERSLQAERRWRAFWS